MYAHNRTTLSMVRLIRSAYLIVVLAACTGPLEATAPASMAQESSVEKASMRIVAVKPTMFFIQKGGVLKQKAEVIIENTSGPAIADLRIKSPSGTEQFSLGTVKNGKSAFDIYVPDTDKPVPVEIALRTDGVVKDRRKATWKPRRHWRVHIVPITHHDLGYTDTIGNVLRKFDGFYDDILRFCAETDDWPEESKYRYTVEGTWSLQHFVENRPEKHVAKLAKYVQQGRIEIGALFGNEISGLCSHEELIRLMYPSFRLSRRFGGSISVGSITDVPGLSWGLPTVLAGAGVEYFFAGLPTYFEWGRSDIHTFWDESQILRDGRPDAFRWEGPDGSSILVYYQGSYGFFKDVTGPHSYQDVMDKLPGLLEPLEKQDTGFDVVRYIHNGVDNYPPDVKISHIVREWNSRWAYPELIVSTNAMFFAELERQCRDIRVFHGELPHTDYVVGATSTAEVTTRNRLTHDRLHAAEKFAAIASLTGDYKYPSEEIRQAYDNMLLYDEHTWGKDYPAGRYQDLAWHEKSHYAHKSAALTESVLSSSLDAIAHKIKLQQSANHIVVFNPLSFSRTDVVRIPRFGEMKGSELVDVRSGRTVPHQIVRLDGPQAPVPYAAQRYARGQYEPHELFDLVFVAENVPPLGYKTYRIVSKEQAPASTSTVTVGERSLENRFFKIVVDPRTGGLQSIFDKEFSREIVDQSAAHKVNQFVARWVKTGELEGPTDVSVRGGQAGPLCASLVVQSRGPGCPQITQEIILYDRIKRIDFADRVLKDSTAPMELYFAFPFKIDKPDFRFEGSNSVIKPLRDQFPGSNSNYYAVQHWAYAADRQVGVTLSPIDSHLVEFGGLWPCYVSQAHHGLTPPGFGRAFPTADELTKGHMYAFVLDSNFRTNFQPVQQGDMLFRFSITSRQAGWKQGRCRDFGWSICNPLIPVRIQGRRNGALDSQMSFCHVDQPNVLALTLKRAETGDGYIVRLIETEGKSVTATISLPHVTVRKAYRTDLVEENQGELSITPHTIEAPVGGFGIATIRFQTP